MESPAGCQCKISQNSQLRQISSHKNIPEKDLLADSRNSSPGFIILSGHLIIMRVDSVFCQKLLMRTALCNSIICNHQNLICIPYGGKAMGNGNGCPVPGKLLQTFLDPALAFIIKSACGFVQNQNRRIFQKYSGNGNPLKALFLSLLQRCHIPQEGT